MKDFRETIVWQRSHALTLEIYRRTKSFPKDEMYGLTGQMRRAAASVPANIAEGCGRDGDPELRRFMTIALGSACELDYFITLAADLGYFPRTMPKNSVEKSSNFGACWEHLFGSLRRNAYRL